MEPARYTDPLEEALSHGSQRVAQLASLAGAMTQVVLHRRALHNARTAARDDEHAAQILHEQERLLRQQARLGWAPAHDAGWLTHADLRDTASAWASAASHADTDPLAASALRKCEDRLRDLHPYAMARYDRLRGDGVSPLDAMRETAPLFSRSPDVRVGDPPTARPALTTPGQDISRPAGRPPVATADGGPQADADDSAELRGRQIITRLRSRARSAGRADPGPDELAMILEAATNLPHAVIDKITRAAAAQTRRGGQTGSTTTATSGTGLTTAIAPATATEHDRTAAPAPWSGQAGTRSSAHDRSAADLAAESFPHGAAGASRAAASSATVRPARLAHAPVDNRRPGPPM